MCIIYIENIIVLFPSIHYHYQYFIRCYETFNIKNVKTKYPKKSLRFFDNIVDLHLSNNPFLHNNEETFFFYYYLDYFELLIVFSFQNMYTQLITFCKLNTKLNLNFII